MVFILYIISKKKQQMTVDVSHFLYGTNSPLSYLNIQSGIFDPSEYNLEGGYFHAVKSRGYHYV
jgi:hypothetical protein